jgi:hypothetical protein
MGELLRITSGLLRRHVNRISEESRSCQSGWCVLSVCLMSAWSAQGALTCSPHKKRRHLYRAIERELQKNSSDIYYSVYVSTVIKLHVTV